MDWKVAFVFGGLCALLFLAPLGLVLLMSYVVKAVGAAWAMILLVVFVSVVFGLICGAD